MLNGVGWVPVNFPRKILRGYNDLHHFQQNIFDTGEGAERLRQGRTSRRIEEQVLRRSARINPQELYK
jgi:hypothetical protein